ncbi:MAG TPA: response regulator [Dehalococcoidales bacterium]|nr:response regulator [Dehalococcoidales bacterium]
MSGERVLVIDDEESIRRFLRLALSAQSYHIFEASTGNEGLTFAATNKPDVIILDLGLPDIDGVEVTKRLRIWTKTPIIILSVRGSESDKIAALDAGADDYLTKPFGIGELLARLRAAIRRTIQSDEPVLTNGQLKVDLASHRVTIADQEVKLTPNEFGILKVLIMNAGKVLTHNKLLKEVWGLSYQTESHLLQVNISNLRRKIEPEPERPIYIITEPGVGYRLKLVPH